MRKSFIKIKLWKTIFLLFMIPLITWNCEDNTEENILNNTDLKTVSKKEVSNLLSQMNKESSSQKNRNSYVEYNINDLSYEEITNTDAKLAVIPCETKNKAEFSRILILKVQNQYKSVVFNMYPSAKYNRTNLFDGEITIATLQGEMLRGFRVQNGEVINFFSSNSYNSKNIDTNYISSKDTENSECRQWCGHQASDPYCICNTQQLDEVVIKGSTSIQYVSISDLYGSDAGNTSNCEIDCDNTWNSVQGGSSINIDDCPDGKVKNDDNICVCPDGYVVNKKGKCVEQPCENDPISNIEIAKQHGLSGVKGGMFGCTRFGGDCIGDNGRNKKHQGMDVKNEYGNPIFAMYDGFIYSTKYQANGAGYYTRIQSNVNGETILTEYFHLQQGNRVLQNQPGQPLVYVKAGDIIGYQGHSGNLRNAIASGMVDSHLHVEVRVHNGSSNWSYSNYAPVDPRGYLKSQINDSGIITNSNCN